MKTVSGRSKVAGNRRLTKSCSWSAAAPKHLQNLTFISNTPFQWTTVIFRSWNKQAPEVEWPRVKMWPKSHKETFSKDPSFQCWGQWKGCQAWDFNKIIIIIHPIHYSYPLHLVMREDWRHTSYTSATLGSLRNQEPGTRNQDQDYTELRHTLRRRTGTDTKHGLETLADGLSLAKGPQLLPHKQLH